jgi:hypothetical protein
VPHEHNAKHDDPASGATDLAERANALIDCGETAQGISGRADNTGDV